MKSFEEWYTDEWVPHIGLTGAVKGQLKILTWMVGILAASNTALIGVVVMLATKV